MATTGNALPTVCVIGAGVAGLAATKQLHEAGIPFDCYDQRDQVGGIWAYTERTGITSVWHSLNMNSPRGTYEFSDYPMPDSYPDFPRWEQVGEYLNDYVDHFGFRPRIHLGTGVDRVSPDASGGWLVTLSSGQERRYDAVIVANGHHNEPRYPDFPGHFSGGTLHSRDYRRRDGYADKRVLVVGFGNSACQVAVDVSQVARDTILAVRRGGYVVPHYHKGSRIDKWIRPSMGYWLTRFMPGPLGSILATLLYRQIVGSFEQFGLPKPDHYFGASFPTISENLINRIGDGRIRVKPNVARLDGFEVTFEDGSRERVDDIIYCTGYHTTFPFLDESIFSAPDNRVPLYKRIFLPKHPGLCFIGAFQAMAWGFLPIMEAQARLVAAYLRGAYALPSKEDMHRDVEQELAGIRRFFTHSPRHNYQMNGYGYVRDCNDEMKRGYRRAQQAGFPLSVAAHTPKAFTRVA